MRRLLLVVSGVNRGVELEQVLDELYEIIQGVIPCNRMGLALVDVEHEAIVARWARSDRPMLLANGYMVPLRGSSLQTIYDTGKVRVIGDLQAYSRANPHSHSSQLLVQEGMRSSLTCPLIARDTPMGFLFFTSTTPNAYNDADGRLYQQITSQVALFIEKARLYSQLANYAQQIEKQNHAVNRDLELARQLQQTFIPQRPPRIDGLDVALLYEPLAQVGGDLVELVPLPGERLLVFMADAMGHGVSAALAMAVVKTTFLGLVWRVPHNPAAILQALNEAVPPILMSQFAAALAMVIDPHAGSISSARAALPPPIIVNGDSGRCRTLDDGGLPLSVDNSEPYRLTDTTFSRGDVVVLATDGLIESVNDAGDDFGMDRLTAAAARCRGKSAQECLQELVDDLARFRGNHLPRDDMSLVLIRRTP